MAQRDREEEAQNGFLTDAMYSSLATECAKVGPWLRGMIEVAYACGWRKSELLKMRVEHVDLNKRTIRLYKTKNGEGRFVKMTEKVYNAPRL